jgi:hypothetical protein
MMSSGVPFVSRHERERRGHRNGTNFLKDYHMKKAASYLLSRFVLLAVSIGFSVTFAAHPPKNATQKIIMANGTPKGVTIQKNKVVLKSGFVAVRVSDHQAKVMAKKKKGGTSGPISGEFTCGCQTNGSCKLVIDGTSIWCAVNTCGSACQMTVSVPTMTNTMQ